MLLGQEAQPFGYLRHPCFLAGLRAKDCCSQLHEGWPCLSLFLPLKSRSLPSTCPSAGKCQNAQVCRALCTLPCGLPMTALGGHCLHPCLQMSKGGVERFRDLPRGAQVGGSWARLEPLSHYKALLTRSSCLFSNSFWVAIKNRTKYLTTQWSPALRLGWWQHEGIRSEHNRYTNCITHLFSSPFLFPSFIFPFLFLSSSSLFSLPPFTSPLPLFLHPSLSLLLSLFSLLSSLPLPPPFPSSPLLSFSLLFSSFSFSLSLCLCLSHNLCFSVSRSLSLPLSLFSRLPLGAGLVTAVSHLLPAF
uniref:uncharacterized protein LOC128932171 n=1 Tax=Callithrix jacchus TaxID=9483 RepID=UPI0023DD0E15|nr:uncharacterized protein LOC128932171 [Callithrix jacchus]